MAAATKPKWGAILGIGGLILAACTIILVLSTIWFGRVTGEEFNPQTFSRRRFSFYELPIIRWQVTGLNHTDVSGDVEQLVQSQSYLPPATKSAATQWHLMSFRRSNNEAPPTDVIVLRRYLDARGEKHTAWWNDWSLRHSDLAKVLWPEVARLARVEMYLALPPLFELARTADDPQALQTELAKASAAVLKKEALEIETLLKDVKEDKQKQAVLQRVGELSKAGLELAPQDEELLRLKELAPVEEAKKVDASAEAKVTTPSESKDASAKANATDDAKKTESTADKAKATGP